MGADDLLLVRLFGVRARDVALLPEEERRRGIQTRPGHGGDPALFKRPIENADGEMRVLGSKVDKGCGDGRAASIRQGMAALLLPSAG